MYLISPDINLVRHSPQAPDRQLYGALRPVFSASSNRVPPLQTAVEPES